MVWRLTVVVAGMLACTPEPLAQIAVLAESGEETAVEAVLTVASYNAWGLPLASEALQERFRKLPSALVELKPDVICLQEVWTPHLRKQVVDGLGLGWHATGDPRGGLVTLSRYPLTEERFVPVPKPKHLPIEERLSGKGVLSVVAGTPAGPVRFVNSHLSHGDQEKVQLRFLREQIGDAREVPVVLAADVNTDPTESAYIDLIRAGLVDAMPVERVEDAFHDPWPPTRIGWPRPEPGAGYGFGWRPDCLLYREGTGLDVDLLAFGLALHTPKTALSDHNLLLATFRLTPRGRGSGR